MIIFRSKKPYSSTTMYNVFASLENDFPNKSLFDKIEEGRKIIFNFDYPTPDNIEPEEFKAVFERMFISKYIDDYFKYETFEKWQIKLYSKMCEVMPTYTSMLSYLFYEDRDKLFLSSSKTTSTVNSEQASEGKTTGSNKQISDKFPANLKTAGTSINKVNYANNGEISENTNENNNSTKGEVKTVSEGTSGNLLDGVVKFNEHYKKIFTDLLAEFAPLFSAIIPC